MGVKMEGTCCKEEKCEEGNVCQEQNCCQNPNECACEEACANECQGEENDCCECECDPIETYVDYAQEALVELIVERVKKRLDAKMGPKLDKIADALSEVVLAETEAEANWMKSDEMRRKLREVLSQ